MKAIIFDMDGVMTNTEPLHYACWKEVLKEDGINLEYETYKACIGSTREFLLNLIKENYGKVYDDPQTALDRMQEKKRVFIEKNGLPIMKGIKEAVERLHEAGYVLSVASSSPMFAIEDTLDKIGIRSCFQRLTSGVEVENSKPAPDTFLCAMEKLNLSPEECLVIEDSTNGGIAAKAAGMKCVWFHNQDSGDQSIPHAELEISEWNEENTEKIIQLMEKE